MRKRTAIIAGCAGVLLVAAAGVYTGISMYYRTHFFEHTAINGIDVSDLTAKEAEALIGASGGNIQPDGRDERRRSGSAGWRGARLSFRI